MRRYVRLLWMMSVLTVSGQDTGNVIVEALGKTERASHAAPFLEALRAELGDDRFQLGPTSGASPNTLIVTKGQNAKLDVNLDGLSHLSILHTAVRLKGAAKTAIRINYADADKPVVRPWIIQDWQDRSKSENTVVSGLWWYRQDKGLVTGDANAKVYVKRLDLDPERRLESIEWSGPDSSRAELRVYAVSGLTSRSTNWIPVKMDRSFNADTILAEPKGPSDGQTYFALEGAEKLKVGPSVLDRAVEIQRTKPDIVLFDPTDGQAPNWSDPNFFWLNEHVLVQPNGRGELIAMWTSERLKPWKWSIKYAHSKDGNTWTKATTLDGPRAAWQVPVVSPTGRIYVFVTHGFLYGGLRCHVSDDGGHTWAEPVELEFAKGPTDHPSPGKKASWISPTIPSWDKRGRPLIGFTRWATHPDRPRGVAGHAQVEYLRIDNLADNPAPQELKMTWLNLDDPITFPHAKKKGASYAQEPYTARLPDGRLMVVVRTDAGHMAYSVSSDEGETWRKAEPLLDRDNGTPLKNPVTPCPIFALDRGDFVLLFNNNDGTGNGLNGPEDRAARRPAFLARGEFRAGAHQPIWFSKPKQFIDNDAVRWGPPGRGRLEAATYVSLTEHAGRRILWYPDRKSFLLGKIISDEWLKDMQVPKASSK